MNNKNYFIFAAAIALASCSVDEYMGENPEFTQTTKENIIGFGGGTGSMSRATSNTGPTNEMLDNQFKVYGWKTMKDENENTTTQKVFNNYSVWYTTEKSSSNPDSNWEYVGVAGTYGSSNVTIVNEQHIKYWDYSASEYKFVAGSPIDNIEFRSGTEEDSDPNAIATATVTGLGGHINPNPNDKNNAIKPAPVYIADPVKITKGTGENDLYGKPVNFNFTRLQTKVRVGIYETIPGYNIKSIEFYEDASSTETNGNTNVILFSTTSNYFVGGKNITGTVTYNWDDTTPSYTFQYNGSELKTESKWYGGKFEGIKATSSNPSQTSDGKTTTTDIIKEFYGEDEDMDGETGYFIVLPTPTKTTLSATTEITPSALTLKCNYTLESEDGSLETINVKGATAAIPAAYCKWEPNKMYTYIFKISQETNGTTGTPGTDDPAGLFPITFDAVATAEENTTQGYETIINTPSITTYQEGSVTDNGIEYVTDTEIKITVNEGTEEKNLYDTDNTVGCVKVYYLGDTEKTEADLVVTRPNTTTTRDVTFGEKTAKFTPKATDITGATATYGYYAIEYCYKPTPSAAYKYKVIKVKKVN